MAVRTQAEWDANRRKVKAQAAKDQKAEAAKALKALEDRRKHAAELNGQPVPVPAAAADTEEAEGTDYASMLKADLQAELSLRNEGRNEDSQIVPESGKKDALVAALQADDEADTEEEA